MFDINRATESEYKPADKAKLQPPKSPLDNIKVLFVALFLTLKLFLTKFVELFREKKPKEIRGQLVLVTGGGNGLGKAISERFAREGCDIAVADIDHNSDLKTAEEIRGRFKVNSKAFRCDISKYSELLKLKTDIESEMRPVDILVNNAGLLYISEFATCSIDDVQRVIDVNLTSHLKITRLFLPTMIERRRGHIVSIASLASMFTVPNVSVYGTTKFGLNGFMKNLYEDLLINDQEFVKLTTVFPDFIQTRKELSDMLDVMEHSFTRLTPERVADEVVCGVLRDKREIVVSDNRFTMTVLATAPAEVRKYLYNATTRFDRVKATVNSS